MMTTSAQNLDRDLTKSNYSGGLNVPSEGKVAKTLEQRTSKIPSDVFLWAAVGSILGSAGLQMAHRRHMSIFVGQWVPTFLLLGIYNKIVKTLGHDSYSRA
jgi:hypothetical protein